MKLTGLLLVVGLLSGCAYLRSNTTRVISVDKFGVNTTTEKTSARAITVFDANASLAKFSNRSGYTTNGTWGPGTYASGVNEQSSASNVVNIINALANVAGEAAKAAK